MVGDILQPTHLLFVLVVALLVLGPKRLPEVAKTLGKGLRDFRGAISGDSDPTDHTPYLSGDNGPDHGEAPAPVSETPVGQTPAPAGGTPPSVSEPPAPVSETAAPAPVPTQAPTPATTASPVQAAAADPQPVQPVDEPVQPITTPATTAPPPQASPSQPTPADDGDAQTHPAERHE